MYRHVVSLLLLASSWGCGQVTKNSPDFPTACPVFPADNVWNTRIDQLPVDQRSESYIRSIGYDKLLHPDFHSALWKGGPIGIPFTVVSSAPGRQVAFRYAEESDRVPYPIPEDVSIEGGPMSDGDRHILVVDTSTCKLYELWKAYPQADGSWKAGSGAIFDLRSNALRKNGLTSADAAGLPVLPGLVRYDEVARGEIRHALRFTTRQTQKDHVWPATHHASRLTDEQYPPMGQRFRLKAAVDISGYSKEAQVILKALKEYGMFLADNGGPWYLSGTPDGRWSERTITDLKKIRGADFEAVDEFSLRRGNETGQVRGGRN